MRITRNIIGVLATVAVILSGVFFGMPIEASAKTHAAMGHTQADAGSPSADHRAAGHHDHAHHPAADDDIHSTGMTGHSEHGLCNTMACCPVVSFDVSGPVRQRNTLRVSHWPDLALPPVQAAPERADKPPRHL